MGIKKYRTTKTPLKKDYFGARLSPELVSRLAQYCDEAGKNASQVVREAIELYIDENNKPEKKEHP